MMRESMYDAVIVGSGPNGLTAAATLACAGLSTLVIEAHEMPGGGARTLPLTLSGFRHDPCASVHPLGAASPIFRALDLKAHGLRWIHSPAPLAHVMGDGSVVTLERSVEDTAAQLGPDAASYRSLVEPLVRRFDDLAAMVLGPARFPVSPLLMARFGLSALRSMRGLARSRFTDPRAGALLAGIAAHAALPLDTLATAAFGLVLGTAGHGVGWPIAEGGSRGIVDALLRVFSEHGGELRLGSPVKHLHDLPDARAILLDVTPRQLLALAADVLPTRYRRALERYRYGPGVFKLDWALSRPIPWKDARCARAATVHLRGDLASIHAEAACVHAGRVPKRPFVLLVQPTLFDPTRAPAGHHIAWAYCHVPHGSTMDRTRAIEDEIERAAPGFRDLILMRAARDARALESYNANNVGGDISGGVSDLRQLFFRPVPRLDPYATPLPHLFLCSSSTPPGGGAHGMCGYFAARSALARVFGKRGRIAEAAARLLRLPR
jgi:phytoene dehydrogenase-like protein